MNWALTGYLFAVRIYSVVSVKDTLFNIHGVWEASGFAKDGRGKSPIQHSTACANRWIPVFGFEGLDTWLMLKSSAALKRSIPLWRDDF